MIGAEGQLSLDEYAMIYHSTGVDIDGRLRSLQRRVTSYAGRLASYLMFMARIPGFSKIPEIDRDALASGRYHSTSRSTGKGPRERAQGQCLLAPCS